MTNRNVILNRTLLKTDTKEGKAVHAFLKNFHILLKNPKTVASNVRQFMGNLEL
jgi:hypothetical protein